MLIDYRLPGKLLDVFHARRQFTAHREAIKPLQGIQ
jgi:hypothetical protein